MFFCWKSNEFSLIQIISFIYCRKNDDFSVNYWIICISCRKKWRFTLILNICWTCYGKNDVFWLILNIWWISNTFDIQFWISDKFSEYLTTFLNIRHVGYSFLNIRQLFWISNMLDIRISNIKHVWYSKNEYPISNVQYHAYFTPVHLTWLNNSQHWMKFFSKWHSGCIVWSHRWDYDVLFCVCMLSWLPWKLTKLLVWGGQN